MSSVTTAVHPDKESVYFQGSLTQMQARQNANINRDNVTFLEIVKNEPRKQSYVDTTEFDAIIGKFPFLSNKFIYKKVIDDARVIPDDMVIKNRMDEYFSPRFYKNILRMYQNAPLYFDYLFSREGINEQRHKQYSVYIYTLCLIEYVMKHYDSNDFKLINGYQLFYDWALPKYSEQVSYIIKGPLSKSSSIKIDFKKHYATIMNPANVEGDLTQTLQLASLQNLDTKLDAILRFVMEMPNVYVKVADHARTYNLIVRSRNVSCYNDIILNNTFTIDLRGCDFGETTEALQRTANLNTIVTASADISSQLSIHKLQELLSRYSRFRIVSCFVDRELFNIALDALPEIDIVIHGVEVASRSIIAVGNKQYDSPSKLSSHLSIPGRFVRDTSRRTYSFEPSIDIFTYASEKVRVTDARIYLSSNGSPLSAMIVGSNLDTHSLYNIELINSKIRNIGQLPNAGFIKTYYYTLADQINANDDSGILKLNNTLSYLAEGATAHRSAFKHGGELIFESVPYEYIDYFSGLKSLADWDGTPDGLLNALGMSAPIDRSIIIPCNDHTIYGYTRDHGIWNERDFIWSIFAIDTSAFVDIFDRYTAGLNGSSSYNYSFLVNVNGEARYTVINQSSIPATISGATFTLIATRSAVVPDFINVSAEFTALSGDRYTIPLFEGLPLDARIKMIFLSSTTDVSYYEATFNADTLECHWFYGICFLPPTNKIFTLFNEPNSFTNLNLTPSVKRIRSMYTVTRILPSLIMNDVYNNTPAIYTDSWLSGGANRTIALIDESNRVLGMSVIDNWRKLMLLTSSIIKELDYARRYKLMVDPTDLFNIQLEFS